MHEAASARRVQLDLWKAKSETEIDAAFGTLTQRHMDALLVSANPFFDTHREQLLALAARHALPAIYAWRDFAAEGGLISYGASVANVSRQLGIYAGKILKGAKPADLPVQQPTKFELVINLKTANALGLTVPPSILARAGLTGPFAATRPPTVEERVKAMMDELRPPPTVKWVRPAATAPDRPPLRAQPPQWVSVPARPAGVPPPPPPPRSTGL